MAERVGITGAGGFIGTRLCERLVGEGYAVAGLDLDEGRAGTIEAAGAEFRRADTTDPGSLAPALGDCARVVHTAAIVNEYSPYADAVRVNVQGTRNVLDAAGGAGATRVVHVSSIAVWGCDFRREIAEDEWPHPYGNSYVDTKGASEVLARRRGAVVVRPGDVYGPGSAQWAVRPLEGVQSGMVRLPSDGRGHITPVYVDDLVDALFRALTAEQARGPYTAWDGTPVPTWEFFNVYACMAGKDPVPTGPRGALIAAAHAMELASAVSGKPPLMTRFGLDYISRTHAYSTARIRDELGWRPEVDFDEGIRRTEAWFRAEGLIE